ncbi:MAG: thiamine pyrophosphate-binding protein [Sphingomonadaceae bacterium]|nr:thiamine pyrophosphate-binding protein [Sphingomonadaceae bacterium]
MPAEPPLKVHQAIARALAANGVDTIFGLVGDANMFMIDSFVRDCGGCFVAAGHEAGAAFMAIGYAALAGRIGVCSVTHGPGMVNTATALVHGVRASVPMLLLCGDTQDIGHSQHVAQRGFAIAAGAGFEQLRSPRTVAQDVARALHRAIAERRPIALDVPDHLDWQEAQDFRPIVARIPESRAVVAASEDLDNAIGIIAAAKRPLVLAGRGAAGPAARQAILKLAARIEAPLATTLKAKDLFRGEDCDLGLFGTLSAPAAVETIMESDCLIAFGASLNDKTMSNGAFRKGKRIVQVNLEPAEIGKHFLPDAGVVGDPAGVAELFHHWLDEAEIPASGFRGEALRERLAADGQAAGVDSDGAYEEALRRLEEILPEDRVLVTDAGRFVVKVWTRMRVRGPDSFLSTVDFGSIGLGLAHAIGAAHAAPGRPVVLLSGDGGFMHGGLAEFNTAVRHGADLVVVICNDRAYGAEVEKYRRRYPDGAMDPGLIAFDWPDFATVATALGGEGLAIRADTDWTAAAEAIRKRTRPLLIDVRLDLLRAARA